MSHNKLIIFSAPSGSGKTTIIKHLLEKKLPLEFSISATSRKPRGKETNGNEYYFLSTDEFKQKINSKDFIEWEEVYEGCFYGTLRSELDRIWKNGKHVLFDVDVIGGLNLKEKFDAQALAIFIKPPSVEILKERLEKRSTDSKVTIEKRLNKATFELQYESKFDKVIVNDVLEDTLQQAEKIVKEFLDIK